MAHENPILRRHDMRNALKSGMLFICITLMSYLTNKCSLVQHYTYCICKPKAEHQIKDVPFGESG